MQPDLAAAGQMCPHTAHQDCASKKQEYGSCWTYTSSSLEVRIDAAQTIQNVQNKDPNMTICYSKK